MKGKNRQSQAGSIDPATYEAWYHTPRGHWIGEREFFLLRDLLGASAGATLLDVGCGTGYFTRGFAEMGLAVTGIDTNPAALEFARKQDSSIQYMQGNALALPFPDNAFDYTMAVTSLCFVNEPRQAFREIWRVTRHALTLGLLNRHSLLYRSKQGRGGYRGARWDTAGEVTNEWLPELSPPPESIALRSAIFFPQGARLAQWSERWLPNTLQWGGFLAVGLNK